MLWLKSKFTYKIQLGGSVLKAMPRLCMLETWVGFGSILLPCVYTKSVHIFIDEAN